MKKKIVVLLSLVLVMCSLLCACGSDETKKTDTQNEEVKEVEQEEETLKYSDLTQYAEIIELTTDNWKDYLEMTQPPADRQDLACVLQIKDLGQFAEDFYGANSIEFSDYSFADDDFGKYSFMYCRTDKFCTVDELECIKIRGKIILLKDVPQEMVQIDENGNEYIEVEGNKIFKGDFTDLSAIVESQE